MIVQNTVSPATLTWIHLLSKIRAGGNEVSPRGLTSCELLASRTSWHMREPVINLADRDLGYRFMAAEAAWILEGNNKVSAISPYSRRISEFSDDGVFFHGAYGPKIVDQLSYVVKSLINDPSSRQAVLNIWREKPSGSKDTPCTLSAQWMIRQGFLHCFVTMRSSDAWLGVPYDVFNFSMVSTGVLALLRNYYPGVALGNLYLTAASQHVYEPQYEAVDEICKITDEELESKIVCLSPLVNEADFTYESLIAYLWSVARGDDGPGFLRDVAEYSRTKAVKR